MEPYGQRVRVVNLPPGKVLGTRIFHVDDQVTHHYRADPSLTGEPYAAVTESIPQPTEGETAREIRMEWLAKIDLALCVLGFKEEDEPTVIPEYRCFCNAPACPVSWPLSTEEVLPWIWRHKRQIHNSHEWMDDHLHGVTGEEVYLPQPVFAPQTGECNAFVFDRWDPDLKKWVWEGDFSIENPY